MDQLLLAHHELQGACVRRSMAAVHRPLTEYANGCLPEVSSLALAASLACALPATQGQAHRTRPSAPLQASTAQAQQTRW